jgi:hypothetical protein
MKKEIAHTWGPVPKRHNQCIIQQIDYHTVLCKAYEVECGEGLLLFPLSVFTL